MSFTDQIIYIDSQIESMYQNIKKINSQLKEFSSFSLVSFIKTHYNLIRDLIILLDILHENIENLVYRSTINSNRHIQNEYIKKYIYIYGDIVEGILGENTKSIHGIINSSFLIDKEQELTFTLLEKYTTLYEGYQSKKRNLFFISEKQFHSPVKNENEKLDYDVKFYNDASKELLFSIKKNYSRPGPLKKGTLIKKEKRRNIKENIGDIEDKDFYNNIINNLSQSRKSTKKNDENAIKDRDISDVINKTNNISIGNNDYNRLVKSPTKKNEKIPPLINESDADIYQYIDLAEDDIKYNNKSRRVDRNKELTFESLFENKKYMYNDFNRLVKSLTKKKENINNKLLNYIKNGKIPPPSNETEADRYQYIDLAEDAIKYNNKLRRIDRMKGLTFESLFENKKYMYNPIAKKFYLKK